MLTFCLLSREPYICLPASMLWLVNGLLLLQHYFRLHLWWPLLTLASDQSSPRLTESPPIVMTHKQQKIWEFILINLNFHWATRLPLMYKGERIYLQRQPFFQNCFSLKCWLGSSQQCKNLHPRDQILSF